MIIRSSNLTIAPYTEISNLRARHFSGYFEWIHRHAVTNTWMRIKTVWVDFPRFSHMISGQSADIIIDHYAALLHWKLLESRCIWPIWLNKHVVNQGYLFKCLVGQFIYLHRDPPFYEALFTQCSNPLQRYAKSCVIYVRSLSTDSYDACMRYSQNTLQIISSVI